MARIQWLSLEEKKRTKLYVYSHEPLYIVYNCMTNKQEPNTVYIYIYCINISVLLYKLTLRLRHTIPSIQWFPFEEGKMHKIIHVLSWTIIHCVQQYDIQAGTQYSQPPPLLLHCLSIFSHLTFVCGTVRKMETKREGMRNAYNNSPRKYRKETKKAHNYNTNPNNNTWIGYNENTLCSTALPTNTI
jgi:hypothetical protein